MEGLKEKANRYAEETVIKVLKEAFARVYSDGYRAGYLDREDEIPVDLCGNKLEYIDLGLPSGTLWTSDYVRLDSEIRIFPYNVAALLNIPTEDQWKELISKCRWEFKGHKEECMRHIICTGPNGNSIIFYKTETQKEKESIDSFLPIHFWINGNGEYISRHLVFLDCKLDDKYNWKYIFNQKEANEIDRFPVRLVRRKGIV